MKLTFRNGLKIKTLESMLKLYRGERILKLKHQCAGNCMRLQAAHLNPWYCKGSISANMVSIFSTKKKNLLKRPDGISRSLIYISGILNICFGRHSVHCSNSMLHYLFKIDKCLLGQHTGQELEPCVQMNAEIKQFFLAVKQVYILEIKKRLKH